MKKKAWILSATAACALVGLRYLISPPAPGAAAHPETKDDAWSKGRAGASADRAVSARAGAVNQDSEGAAVGQPRPRAREAPTSAARPAESIAASPAGSLAQVPAPAVSDSLDSSETVRFGTVKVLGHRGCDLNTQGWFLSVGSPEQYDFDVSEDGETLVVEPNSPELAGNFELVHCVDPGALLNKRVRFSARVKAQGVTQTAQLRLRGEDIYQKVIVGGITRVVGSHDWKDFSVEAEVTAEVSEFSYGLTFRSPGKLWISQPTFTVLK